MFWQSTAVEWIYHSEIGERRDLEIVARLFWHCGTQQWSRFGMIADDRLVSSIAGSWPLHAWPRIDVKSIWRQSKMAAVRLRRIASEGNKRRSGNFFVTGRPVLASCKTSLTRKPLFCLYFWKTKSEELIVSDLFGYTGPTAKRRMRACSPSVSNKVSLDGF